MRKKKVVPLNFPSRICSFFGLDLQGSSVFYVGHVVAFYSSLQNLSLPKAMNVEAQSEYSFPNICHCSPPLIPHMVFISGFASCLNFSFSFMRFCRLALSLPFIFFIFPLCTSGSHLLHVASLWVCWSSPEVWSVLTYFQVTLVQWRFWVSLCLRNIFFCCCPMLLLGFYEHLDEERHWLSPSFSVKK